MEGCGFARLCTYHHPPPLATYTQTIHEVAQWSYKGGPGSSRRKQLRAVQQKTKVDEEVLRRIFLRHIHPQVAAAELPLTPLCWEGGSWGIKWHPGGETDDSGLCKGTEGDRIPLIEAGA